jgi:IclR family KDG regulon transcriptional repressor
MPTTAKLPKTVSSAPTPFDDGAPASSVVSLGRNIRRVLELLALLQAADRPLRVRDLADGLGIPRSTAYQIVNVLRDAEYIEQSGEVGGYRLGQQLYLLGMAYRERVDLLKDGAKVLEALRDQTGETVQLCVLDHERILVLMKLDGKQPIRIISKVGTRVPVNWGASGRLLVSDLPDKELRRLLAATVTPLPQRSSPVDIAALIAQIRRFRAQGYAIEINEANEHAGCVAAPVLDINGCCIATLSIVAPEFRLQPSCLPPLIEAVGKAAARLSRKLGGVPGHAGGVGARI